MQVPLFGIPADVVLELAPQAGQPSWQDSNRQHRLPSFWGTFLTRASYHHAWATPVVEVVPHGCHGCHARSTVQAKVR
eukprot:3890747-Amphidinium_carterae.2